jgi:hypothetical protein
MAYLLIKVPSELAVTRQSKDILPKMVVQARQVSWLLPLLDEYQTRKADSRPQSGAR